MKNFVQQLIACISVITLCSCSTPRFPTLLQENQQTQTEQENGIQGAKFNSFVEQKTVIYREQYQQIKSSYKKIAENNSLKEQDNIKNLEQKISVLTDAINYSLNDKRATNKDKSELKLLSKQCSDLLSTIRQEKTPDSITTAQTTPHTTTSYAEKEPAISPNTPLFGTKANLEGEKLLSSGKKPALVIKAATEYETALNTIVKATANSQNQMGIDIINLTTPQEASQTAQFAYAVYKEIILMGMDEDKVTLSQKTDATIKESAILVYTR